MAGPETTAMVSFSVFVVVAPAQLLCYIAQSDVTWQSSNLSLSCTEVFGLTPNTEWSICSQGTGSGFENGKLLGRKILREGAVRLC